MTKVLFNQNTKLCTMAFADEDMEDLLTIQLAKKTTIEATIEACFHAGLVTILTHSPRKFERTCNHGKTKKEDKS